MTTTTTTTPKPRWVECADKAAEALEAAPCAQPVDQHTFVARAEAWMRLAVIYRDGQSG